MVDVHDIENNEDNEDNINNIDNMSNEKHRRNMANSSWILAGIGLMLLMPLMLSIYFSYDCLSYNEEKSCSYDQYSGLLMNEPLYTDDMWFLNYNIFDNKWISVSLNYWLVINNSTYNDFTFEVGEINVLYKECKGGEYSLYEETKYVNPYYSVGILAVIISIGLFLCAIIMIFIAILICGILTFEDFKKNEEINNV